MALAEESTESHVVVAQLAKAVAARAPEERRAAAEAFATAYLRRRSGDAEEGVDALAPEVLGALDLAASRGGAPMAVRAFTPSPDEHGYERDGSVLETNTEDLPFLVDSVTAEIESRGLTAVRVLHPIIGTVRGPGGSLERVCHPREAQHAESVMHFELDRRLAPAELAALEDGVRAVLTAVRAVVADFGAMRAQLEPLAARLQEVPDGEELAAFVRWLDDDAFIFLGFDAPGGPCLGVLADGATPPSDLGDEPLVVTKTTALSPVHRRARMDEVSVGLGPAGAGRARIVGLFTTRAYATPAEEVPLLRGKLERVTQAEDLIPGSHDFKAVVALFESFPRDELFAAGADDLRRAVVALLDLRPDRTRLLLRRAGDGRTVSAILALPRERYDAALVTRARDLLVRRFAAEAADVQEVLGEGAHARLHVAVHGATADPGHRELEAELAELTRTWDDRTAERLAARFGAQRGGVLAARWLGRLPDYYKAELGPAGADEDVASLERLHASGRPLAVALRNEEDLTRVVLYRRGAKTELSTVLPVLEHLGLRVVVERPTRLEGRPETWIQDFGVLGPGDRPLDLDECGDRVADVLAAVLLGEAESDSLHRLVVSAGLRRPQLEVLRAFRKYRQRIGSRFTEGYQNDVIAANPGIAAKLLELFEVRFDPSRPYDDARANALRDAILADLEQVTSLDDDRILRNQLGLIEATVRTNAYRPGRGAIAFKLRSAHVPAIPQPAPLFEIYVFGPGVEGIHLRGGKIARGGLRWSDRMDYRTEVFGLMRAQMTKNAVIVPDGAKGGFYLRRRPADTALLRAEVEQQYTVYINALLDVTDDLRDGRPVPPDGVRCFDEPDPYLVVAADKGTATLSDTANAIAQGRGFWLGDAFASGGSNGYDHKALGITARGAWESLKRHMRELGRDPATDPFSVVGIGDMSGDVFGNGMLLSDRIRLVAAYDHRHVFIDPDPDPGATFVERRRLFGMPGSSWDDFDRSKLSAGGGVWPRTAKAIALPPEARAALGIAEEVLAPTDLIRAILRAPVDVLWNGGIGTVVKASTETDDDAQDRSSDAIRVDAADLRCRIVAEGGNLGLTQRARIEFARRGGLVNADFIDNSAGVDCSDHEVNLKVLLDVARERGELDDAARDALLREVTEDVADHVLQDSFLQAQILTQEVRASAGRMFAYEDLMLALEQEGLVERGTDRLPTSEEMAERRRDGRGMERPELAVLLANAKRSLTAAVLASALPDDDALATEVLREYFPDAVVARCGHLLLEHPLRRELVATRLGNEVVDSLGVTFASRLVTERGAAPAAVVRAFRVASGMSRAQELWQAVEALPRHLDRDLAWSLMDGLDELVEALARRVLDAGADAPLQELVARQAEGFARFAAVLPAVGDPAWCAEREQEVAGLVEAGVPERVARVHAYRAALADAPEAVAVAQATGRSIEEVAAAFATIGDRLRLGWLEDEAAALPHPTRMGRWAAQAVSDDVGRARRDLTLRALQEAPDAAPEEAVEAFLERRAPVLERLRGFAAKLDVEGTDLAGLTLAVRHLRALL